MHVVMSYLGRRALLIIKANEHCVLTLAIRPMMLDLLDQAIDCQVCLIATSLKYQHR